MGDVVRYPLLQFVDSPDRDADLRLDFHADDCWTTNTAFQIVPGDFLGDPGGFGGEDGYTAVGFTWFIHAASRVDATAQVSRLAREMRRPENYLLFQPTELDAPLWFRTLRSTAGALSLQLTNPDRQDEDVWMVTVSLVADYAALGEQQTLSVTVQNDPTETDGLAVVLDDIVGDVPAPLVIEIPAESDTLRPLVAVTPLDGDVWPGLQFWQVDEWTLGTDATTTADSTASGGTRVTVDFATDATMAVRATGAVTAELAGTYRVFGRVSAGAAGTFTVKGGGDALVSTNSTEIETTTGWQHVDLGLYAFPKWNMPTEQGYTLAASLGLADVTVRASRDSGVGSLYVDYLVAIPCDLPVDGLGESRMLDFSDAIVDDIRIDGELERLLTTYSTGAYRSTAPQRIVGGFPQVTPGASNVLHFLRRSVNLTLNDTITDTTTLTLTYRPRHVYFAGS